MKRLLFISIIAIFIASCNSNNTSTRSYNNCLSSEHDSTQATLAEEDLEFDEFELYYVVSASSGYNYDSLHQLALAVSKELNFQFDTLGRGYDKVKKRIVLPENSEDEMYAGDYFLRREGGDFVSIEMQCSYIDTLTQKNMDASEFFERDNQKMFVCATMFANKEDADALLKKLKPKFKNTSIIPTELFMGCMH